jgi:pimeloyl-ACP methyl ester carboxylesterase
MPITPIASGRTRFARDIVAEFYMPARPSQKAIIVCDGCPTVPSKRKVGEFLARKGFWVFHPRYRGSWESSGKFLARSPHEDVLLVADGIRKGFTNIYDDTEYFLDITEIIVIGSSFGGAAALLASCDPRITKAVALSPVIDWRVKSKGEPFLYFVRMIREAFGDAYRIAPKGFEKLESGNFFNPILEAKAMDQKKLFVVHALDDKIVSIAPLRQLAKAIHLKPHVFKEGGHFSTSFIMEREVWKEVNVFIKNVKN